MRTTHTDAVQILSSIWKSLWNRLVQQKRECESPCRTTATMTAMAAAALMTNSPAQTYWRCESLGKFFVLRHRLGAKIQPKIFQYCCCRLCVWMVCVLCAGPPMCECLAVAIAVDCIRKLLRYTYTKVYILHWWLSVCRFISLAASCHFSRSKRFILDYYDCCCCCWLVCALLQICSVECFSIFARAYECDRIESILFVCVFWIWPTSMRSHSHAVCLIQQLALFQAHTPNIKWHCACVMARSFVRRLACLCICVCIKISSIGSAIESDGWVNECVFIWSCSQKRVL